MVASAPAPTDWSPQAYGLPASGAAPVATASVLRAVERRRQARRGDERQTPAVRHPAVRGAAWSGPARASRNSPRCATGGAMRAPADRLGRAPAPAPLGPDAASV